MAKTKEQKKDIVKIYADKLKDAKAVYFIDAKAISAVESTDMKKALSATLSNYNVIKNRLFKIALKEAGFDMPDSLTEGQNAVVFTSEEGVAEAAKIIKNFIKDKEKSEIKAGILDGNVVSAEQVIELADLPSKDVMIARVLGTMNAPIYGFVNVLAANIRGVVQVISAIKDQKAATV